jgi:SAM-dependent methyltransferase
LFFSKKKFLLLSLAMTDALAASVQEVAAPWADSDYYRLAEQWTDIFWNHDGPFRPLYDQLDKRAVIELAVGYGRHAERAAPHCGTLIVMDVIAYNVKICRLRLQKMANVGYVVNNGFDYQPVPDGAVTGIYCYDAMVHFSPDLVEAYLADTFRVLKPGGRALFHHSNYLAPDDRHYGQNPHARNSMSQDRFGGLAGKAGLIVRHSDVIPWTGVAALDGVTLVEKPAA